MNIYNPFPTPLFDNSGSLAVGAKAYFYRAGTTTPLAVFQDASKSTQHTWPVVANMNGVLPPIFIDYVDYRVRITTAAGGVIFDADNIANPAPPSAGGGGGIAVTQSQIFNTGYTTFRIGGGNLDGFVRMNGRTIGSISSSATERANDDCEALFKYLWQAVADTYAPVSGGRGSTADADWLANKSIGVPSMQGRAPIGVEGMGGTAENVAQLATTANVTNGSPTITVTTATGICRGMRVWIDNVYSGKVSNRVGTTITLDTNYAGTTGTGKTTRFSFVDDPTVSGSPGGMASISMTTLEMPSHTHTVTDPGHTHTTTYKGLLDAGFIYPASPSPGSVDGGTITINSATTGITLGSTGGGYPMGVFQPLRAVTFYIKL